MSEAGAPPSQHVHSIWLYRAMLLLAALIWGGSFMILKGALDIISPAWLIALRFLISGVILAAIFHTRLKKHLDFNHIRAGVLIGTAGGLGYLVQNMGLVDTTPSNNAFLTSIYCVLVPFLAWFAFKKRPQTSNFVAALLCLIGVGFVSLDESMTFSLRWGDWMTLLSALCFAIQIVIIEKYTQGLDILAMTVIDVFTMGLISFIKALVSEPFPAVVPTFDLVVQLSYVILLSSCLCTILQNVGQSHVPGAQASILLSLESVFGVMFSVLFYGDPLTARLIMGFGLIFIAVVISEAPVEDYIRQRRERLGRTV
jgi:drug/metabolite transporter (DMT)-like permease